MNVSLIFLLKIVALYAMISCRSLKNLSRIESVDLSEKKARYHNNCYSTFFRNSSNQRGRPVDQSVKDAAQFVVEYLSGKGDKECQFSVKEILENYDNDESVTNMDYIAKEINLFFGEQVIIYTIKKPSDLIVCFRAVSFNLFHDATPLV